MVDSRRVQNELPRPSERRRPSARARVDFPFHFISFLISCPPHRLALDSKTSFKLQHKTKYPF